MWVNAHYFQYLHVLRKQEHKKKGNHQKTMAKHFTNDISQTFNIVKRIPPATSERWITFSLVNMHRLKGEFIAVDSLRINCSEWCPTVVTWNKKDLVKRSFQLVDQLSSPLEGGETTGRIHGVTDGECQWDRRRDLPPKLDHNIWQFFLSNLQVAYMNIVRHLQKKRSWRLSDCCPKEMLKRFRTEEGANPLECLIVPLDFDDCEDNHLMTFLQEVAACDALLAAYKQYQQVYVDRLLEYGIKLEKDSDLGMYIYNETHYLYPLDAVRQMLGMCQELEENGYMYLNNENDPSPILCHVLVPQSDRVLTVTAQVKLLLGTYPPDETCCCRSCQEEEEEVPEIIEEEDLGNEGVYFSKMFFLQQKISLCRNGDENLKFCNGPSNVKKGFIILFENQ